MNKRIVLFKGLLWFFAGLAAAVAVARLAFGLGAATNLSDSTPWGLWVGFDVMGGVALASGGFVIAALVHIFHRDKFHAAARPAILTAFLGYGAVAVGLLFDLGLPWHIWHPMIFWNPRSPLFEVAWCVMLYLTVLALEVAPTILVKTRFTWLFRFLSRLALPIMILGIMLSTLHQSSLGSLLLIMPFRVHPLWYSSWLPELFFISAICLGICMVMFESCITSWLYKRKPETEMLAGLGKLAACALGLYFVIRMVDIFRQGKFDLIFESTWVSNLFIVEMFLFCLLPVILFAIPKVRHSYRWIWFTASLPIFGFVLNRISASGLSQVWTTGTWYFPAWTEFSISIGIVSACALVFFFIQEHFPVDPHGLEEIEEKRELAEKATPAFAPFTQVWLGEGWRRDAKVYSMLFILAAAIGFTAAPKFSASEEVPAQRARGKDIIKIGTQEPFVYYNHAEHVKTGGMDQSCSLCHHLNKVGDVGTPCSECHRSMFEGTDIFDHDLHIRKQGGNGSCDKCHGTTGASRFESMKTCEDCHAKDMMAENPVVKTFTNRTASGYRDAMHKMCIPCHVKSDELSGEKKTQLRRCGTCHDEGIKSEVAYKTVEKRYVKEQATP